MFDHSVVAEMRAAVARVADLPVSLATGREQLDLLRELQAAQRVLDGVKADALEQVETTRAYEDEGASSLTTWAARELRVSSRDARALSRAAATLRALPTARAALAAGEIGLDHVHQMTYARKVLPPGRAEAAEEFLLTEALAQDPAGMHRSVKELKDYLHTDALDEAWGRGQDKIYLNVEECGEGYHVEGFLDVLTGVRLRRVLDGFGRPTDAEDTRMRSQRRIDGLNHLLTGCTHADGSQTPAAPPVGVDLTVVADHTTLTTALASSDESPFARRRIMRGLPPAVLTGHGPIGPDLLTYLHCDAHRTGVLTTPLPGHQPLTAEHATLVRPGENTRILNVGRTHRLATPRQRRAVTTRQAGTCASPSCRHPVAEVHHTTWWSAGGGTDLVHLIGLCTRCHVLVHQHKLTITAADADRLPAAHPPERTPDTG